MDITSIFSSRDNVSYFHVVCSTRINFLFLFCRVLATEEDNFVSYKRNYNRRIKFVAPAHAKRNTSYYGTTGLLTGAKKIIPCPSW